MNPLDRFDTVVRQGKDGVVAIVPDLHLYCSAGDLNQAMVALTRKKEALLADLSKADLFQEAIERARDEPEQNIRRQATQSVALMLFSAKVAIVLVLIAAITGLSASLAMKAIRADVIHARVTMQRT